MTGAHPTSTTQSAGILICMGQADGDMVRAGEMGLQREETLLEAMLRHQAGIDPDRVGPVLDLAAVGIVNSAWRNSPVEDWHAGDGPLDDGDMLRINAHTTWRVRQIIRRWRAEVGLTPESHVTVLDAVEADAVDWLAVRIFRWLVTPTRRLPTGMTLAELAGDDLGEFSAHVEGTLGGFAATAESRGARHAVWQIAAHGGLACSHWWGTPTWSALVSAFLQVIDDPRHAHGGSDGSLRARLPPAPAQVADRAGLERILRRQPWSLESDAAQWVVNAGIGYLRSPLPALPDHIEPPV